MLSLTEPSWYDKNGVLQTIKSAVLEMFYPVGSIYMSTSPADPSTFMGGGWTSWGQGKVPVGVNTSDSDFSTVEKTGGAKTVTLTESQMPAHKHDFSITYTYQTSEVSYVENQVPVNQQNRGYAGESERTSKTYSTNSSGSGNAHNNLQPYITCYMWKRTS